MKHYEKLRKVLRSTTFDRCHFFWGLPLIWAHPPPSHPHQPWRVSAAAWDPDWRAAVFCSRFRVQWIFAKLGGEAALLQPLESGDPQWGRISYPPALRLLIFPLAPERGENGLSSMTARICSNYAQRSKHLAETKTLQKWNCSYFMKWHHFANWEIAWLCFQISD